MSQTEGTYKWRVIAEPSIVAQDLGDGKKLIATPTADETHLLATVRTGAQVGSVGRLLYVSNFPLWGRLEFEA